MKGFRPARLSLAIALVGLLVVASRWIVLYELLEREQVRVVEAALGQARSLAQILEESTKRQLQQIDQITRLIGADVSAQRGPPDFDALVRRYTLAQPGFVALYIADAAGDVRGSTIGGAGVNIADREHFRAHRDGRHPGLFISKPVLSRITGKWVVQLTRGLSSPSGEFAGVVVASVDPSYFTSLYGPANFGANGTVTVIGRDGIVRARRVGDKLTFGDSLHPALMAGLAKATTGAHRMVRTLDGVPRFVAYREVTGYPLVAAAGLSHAEVFEPYLARRAALVALASGASLALIVCFAGLAVLVWRLGQSRKALGESEQRLRDVTDNLPVLIKYVDSKETITFMNRTIRDWMGLEAADVIGRSLREAIGEERYAQRREPLQRCLRGERVAFDIAASGSGRTRFLHNVYIPHFDASGAVAGVYAVSSDVTALKEVESRLNALARVDTLTGLPNRYRFNEVLPEALARAQHSGSAIALMFLDIDHFKEINDTLGHAAGDHVLREFARRLKDAVRSTDTVARLAGDEFVAILEGIQHGSEAERVAEKVIEQVDRPFEIEGRTIAVTTSVGVALTKGRQPITASEFLARADRALYTAKTAGRNTHHMSLF